MSDDVLLTADVLEQAITEILTARRVPDADAAAVANALTGANLRGIDTHGVSCLPDYVRAIDEHRIKAAPEMLIGRRFPWAASLDADNGLGPVAATRAMNLALEMAETVGIGAVAVRRSNHFGAAGIYALMAAEAGCVGIVCANASTVTAPFGAAKPFLGTNPLAVAVPAGDHPPYLLDMATAEGSRKKIRRLLAEGKEIPTGWALCPDGEPTTDPQKALDGVMLPFGGSKGSGIALLVDILAGVLTGAEFGGGVLSVMTNQERESGNGHFMLVFRANAFLPEDDLKRRMDEELDRMKALPAVPPFPSVSYPGERSWKTAAMRRKNGIPVSQSLKNQLKDLGAHCLP